MLSDSAGLTTLKPSSFTAFRVAVKTASIDLRKAPFEPYSEIWRHPTDYSGTQKIGRSARKAGIGAIIYHSVRDPAARYCSAILTPRAFAAKNPEKTTQSWVLTVSKDEAVWMRPGHETFSFWTGSGESP